jgi:hypothetical protein
MIKDTNGSLQKKTALPAVTHNYIEASPELLFERALHHKRRGGMYYGKSSSHRIR